jgi:hypothetical protein
VSTLALDDAGLKCALHGIGSLNAKGSGILRSDLQSVNFPITSLSYGKGLLLVVEDSGSCGQRAYSCTVIGLAQNWILWMSVGEDVFWQR